MGAPFIMVRTDIRKDERVSVVADLAQLAGGRAHAQGALVDLWCHCADRGLADAPPDSDGYAVSELVIRRFLGPHGVVAILADGHDDMALGVRRPDGLIYLRGTSNTVAALRKASAGGRSRAASRDANSGQFTKSKPAQSSSAVGVTNRPATRPASSQPEHRPGWSESNWPDIASSQTASQDASQTASQTPARRQPDGQPDASQTRSQISDSKISPAGASEAETTDAGSKSTSAASAHPADSNAILSSGNGESVKPSVRERQRIWRHLCHVRSNVIAELHLQARPLPVQDPGERDLALYLAEAERVGRLEDAARDAMHVIEIAAIEARRADVMSVRWMSGAIFEPRRMRELAGMSEADAAKPRNGRLAAQQARNVAAEPTNVRKLKTLS